MKKNSVRLYLSERLVKTLLATGLLPALLLLAGCTEGQVLDGADEGIRPVTLHFSRPDLGAPAGSTRAGTDPAPESLPAGATVRIAAYFRRATDGPADFATTAPTYQATYEVQADGSLSPCTVDADGKKTDAVGSGLTVRGGTYDFYAVSPARTLEIPTVVPPATDYQITGISHKEDVMTSFIRGVTVSTSANIVALNPFSRKCARVVFNVEPDAGNAVPIVSLKGKKLVLKGISEYPANLVAGENRSIPATRGTVNDPNAQLEFIDTEFVEFTSPGGSMTLNKTIGAILPKTTGSFDVAITVERDGQTADLTATIDQENLISFDPGKSYVFTLRVKNNKASLYMKVLDWNLHVVTDLNVGTIPGPVPSTDPDIVPGVGIPMQVAEWNNIIWTGNGSAGGSQFITIDQRVADAYKAKFLLLSNYPPFNYDQGIVTGVLGSDYKGDSQACTVDAPYLLEVESVQSQTLYPYDTGAAFKYCNDKGSGWRLPMIIELFAMWDKVRGSDDDATDDEEASSILGEAFLPNYSYWSSSVYYGNSSRRCKLNFYSGGFGNTNTYTNYYVRCVRDIN